MKSKRQLEHSAAAAPRPEGRAARLLAALRRVHWVVLTLTPVVWTHFLEVRPAADFATVPFYSSLATLVAALVALIYVRRLDTAPVEMGWMLFAWSRLVQLLDAATLKPPGLSQLAHMVEGGLGAVGIAGIVAAMFYLKRTHERNVESLETSHENYQGLISTLDAVTYEADPESLRYTYVSRKAEALLGYAPSEWLDNPTFWADRMHQQDGEWASEYRRNNIRRREGHQLEYRMKAVDGRTLWIRDSVRIIFEADGRIRLRGVLTDITARKLLETQLHHNATHDPLTGLPNRAAFIDRLEQAKSEAVPGSSLYSVLFLDLDRFKLVNDSLGHLAGDELLVTVSARLSRCVRGDDLVARLGGDEFGVLLAAIPSEETSVELARRLLETVSRPATVAGCRVTPSASVGIVVGGPGRSDPTSLLRDADTAMYRAKENARGSFQIFRPAMRTQIVHQVQMEADLRRALEQEELELQLQPIVELDSGSLESFEGLIRWRRPNGDLALPKEFLGYAEDSGLMRKIGWRAFERACEIRHEWNLSGAPATPIAVNLSEAQFTDEGLLGSLDELLARTRIQPSELYLEITETVMAEADEPAIDKLLLLKERGFRLALDDFGTGRSSLSRLCSFPIDVIKVDRGFVRRLGNDGPERSLVRAVLTLADDLGIDVVAEGIETIEQLTRLQAMGCRYGQGFLFSKAVPENKARALLEGRPFDAYGSRETPALSAAL